MITRFIISCLVLLSLLGINACKDSAPPVLMKATIPFETDEERDHHIEHMRTHHMHALKHKRDETMYQGIRTEDHSLKACINCHVPESYKGKILRHTDQEHFCTTCHTYVAEKLNCFECHVDHPVKTDTAIPDTKIQATENKPISVKEALAGKDLSKLSQQELHDLAFTYSKHKPEWAKQPKSGGVSFTDNKIQSDRDDGVINEKK